MIIIRSLDTLTELLQLKINQLEVLDLSSKWPFQSDITAYIVGVSREPLYH